MNVQETAMMMEGSELRVGAVLGAYRIVRCIAIGGMGTVYEAEHCQLGKRVALKTPHSPVGSSTEGRARFLQEGKTAAKIRHPHVVDITDVGEVDDVAYLVMEYLDGESLSALIEREGPLATGLIADVMVPVAAALHQAHGMGVIHRDLKPENIFLTRSVQGKVHPKILDFGVSKVLGDEMVPKLTTARDILGTPQYLSPETLRDALAITDKSDQYSLGVVIYEASTGRNPFADHSSLVSILMSVDQGDYLKPTEVNRNVDAGLEEVVLRAMSVSPSERFPSLAALGARLLPLASPDTRSAWTSYFVKDYEAPGLRARTSSLFPWPRASWAMAAVLGVVSGGAAATVAINPDQKVRFEALAPGVAKPRTIGTSAATPAASGEPSITHPEPRAPSPQPVVSGATSASSSASKSPARPPRLGDDEPLVDDRVTEKPRTAGSRPALEVRARPAGAPTKGTKQRHTAAMVAESTAPSPTSSESQPIKSEKTNNIDPWGPDKSRNCSLRGSFGCSP